MNDGIRRLTPELNLNVQRLTRFSGGLAGRLAASSFIPAALMFMEKNNNAEVIIKDVLGFNAPKMSVAAMRSKGDFLDTTRLEMSNTVFTTTSLLFMPPLFRKLAAKMANLPSKALLQDSIKDISSKTLTSARFNAQKQLAHIGGSLGFMTPFALAYVAIPFVRNYLTLKQNGTANFEAIIGLEKDLPQTNKKQLNSQLDQQLNIVKKIMGWGLGLGIAASVGLGALSKRLPQTLSRSGLQKINSAYNWLKMGGKRADQLSNDFTVFAFWLLPAYVGYLVSARSKHEFREQLIKSVNGVLWFTLFNRFITKPYFGSVFKGLQKQFGVVVAQGPRKVGPDASLWQRLMYKANMNKYVPSMEAVEALKKINPLAHAAFKRQKVVTELLQLGISILGLAASPAILNIFLTRQRYAAEQRHKAQLHNARFAASPSNQI